eukprot:TRINITY_DN1313_c0_g1_i2.p1 TRINITY_DN1313_c0_g1~~TRINITY_DN1313_c0_g1_i2.p1  ORF type:complete len:178 (+),score=16.96 TRINITY_DN1313_c0_g1_i2:316-849(+)
MYRRECKGYIFLIDIFEPTVVFCTPSILNSIFPFGNDGWRCQTELPADVVMKDVKVICDPPFQPHEYNGKTHSCRLEYSLLFEEDFEFMDDDSIVGSFLSVVLGILVPFLVFRHRRPNNNNNNPGQNNRGINSMRARGPPSPKVLRAMGYSVIGILVFSIILFISLIGYMLTSIQWR